ncbi:metastasis-associated MTA3-like, partial [Paramuricea clavata]
MSTNTNSRIYRVGDYVYVETAPVYPYQIRRIEELTKLGNGQIEAKVQCFYRRRDLSNPLIAQADRHAGAAEEDAEIDMGDSELDDTKMHQLSHRELFLSRQYETINASQIRGKCLVTLYCETEELPRYSGKEDWFYYCLVYDPQQKALLADKGEIGIGSNYQPVVPQKLEDTNEDTRDLCQLETKIWTTDHTLTDREVDQFLVVSRSVGTFARALDCSSSVKQPSLHMSAAAASRDITQFHALSVLHKSSYELSKAVGCLVPTGGPVLCRDEMEEWSAGEAGLFEEAINKYGKDFSDIQKDFLPWKSISSIIEYYYMWKTTDRYVRQKRMKSVEKESDLKQILVSNPPGTTCVTGSGDKESVNSIPYPPPGVITKPPTPGYSCESCYANTSTHWFPWSTPNTQYRHYVCSVCWVYWKKYGGLKKPDGFSSRRVGEEVRYTCRICGKVFNRA